MALLIDRYIKKKDEEELIPSQKARVEQEVKRELLIDRYLKPKEVIPEPPKPPSLAKRAISKITEIPGAISKFLFGEPKLISPVPEKPQVRGMSEDQYVNATSAVYQYRQETENMLRQSEQELETFKRETPFLLRATRLIPGGKKEEQYKIEKRIEALRDAVKDYDNFLTQESARRGVVQGLVEKIKTPVKTFLPFFQALDDWRRNTKEGQARAKYDKGEQLTTEEMAYVQSHRAKVFNSYVEKGMGAMVGEVIADMPRYMGEIAIATALVGPVGAYGVAGQKLLKFAKIASPLANKIVPNILANSVRMAAAGSISFPQIGAKLSNYLLPTYEVEEKLEDRDILTLVKPGFDPKSAMTKAVTSQISEYVTEGLGNYIDGANVFFKKAVIGKFLKNKELTDPTLIQRALKNVYWNGLLGEVIEEEANEPIQAWIDERKYQSLLTPEGRERLLVETLGIAGFGGLAKVADVTTQRLTDRRETMPQDKVETEVIPVKEVPPEMPAVIREEIEKREKVVKPGEVLPTVEKKENQIEMLTQMKTGTGKFEIGEVYTQVGRPEANKIIVQGIDEEGNVIGNYIHEGLLSPAIFKPSELKPFIVSEEAKNFVLKEFGVTLVKAEAIKGEPIEIPAVEHSPAFESFKEYLTTANPFIEAKTNEEFETLWSDESEKLQPERDKVEALKAEFKTKTFARGEKAEFQRKIKEAQANVDKLERELEYQSLAAQLNVQDQIADKIKKLDETFDYPTTIENGWDLRDYESRLEELTEGAKIKEYEKPPVSRREARPEELPGAIQVGEGKPGVPAEAVAKPSEVARREYRKRYAEPRKRPTARITIPQQVELNKRIEALIAEKGEDSTLYSDEEKELLKQYTGVGGLEKGGAEGRGLLDEYYTPVKLVNFVWDQLQELGIKLENIDVLEPSVGIGRFLENVKGTAVGKEAYEINKTAATITKVLYPDTLVENAPFESLFITERGEKKERLTRFDVVVGNPPYGEHRGKYLGLGEEPKITKYEEYFLKKGLDTLSKGGVLAYIMPSSFLRGEVSYAKQQIAEMAKLERAYRLPNKVFPTTEIGTDILIFRKVGKTIPQLLSNDEYFVNYPKRVLGKVVKGAGQYGADLVEGSLDEALRLAGYKVEEVEIEIAQKPEEVEKEVLPVDKELDTGRTKAEQKVASEVNKKVTIISDKKDEQIYLSDLSKVDKELWENVEVTGELNIGYIKKKFGDIDLKDFNSNDIAVEVGVTNLYYPNILYYQGNIYERLDNLEANKTNLHPEQYKRQREGLEKVLPPAQKITEINLKPNDAFVAEIKITPATGEKYNLIAEFRNWLHQLPHEVFGNSSSWEVENYIAGRIVNTGDKIQNVEVRKRRREVGDRLFNRFLREEIEADEIKQIEDYYNRNFNAYFRPDYKEIPLLTKINKTFKKKPLKIHDLQKEGAAFLALKGVGLLGHEVGLGKTMTSIVALNEVMNKGWVKRPLIVVPNAVYLQWIRELTDLIPGVKINSLANLGGKFKGDLSTLEIEDGTISLITYDGLVKLGFRMETYDDLTADLQDVMLGEITTKRARAKEEEKVGEVIGRAIKGTTGERFFEDLGFDHLTIDEVHNFKNIFAGAKLESGKGNEYRNVRGSTSARGIKAYLMTQYILKNNKGRNVFLLSATPFTNSPMEIYSILSLMGKKRLENLGLKNVNDFMSMFMDMKAKFVVKADQTVREEDVIERFTNLQQLQKLVTEFIDFRTGEEIGIERPDRVKKTVTLGPTQTQVDYILKAQDLFNKREGGAIVAITELQNITLSPYLSRYYSPVGKKGYFIAEKMGFKEVEGKEVDLGADIDAFVYQMKDGSWSVTEGRSGKQILQRESKDYAIESAKDAIESQGMEKVNRLIEESIQTIGLSPRYAKPGAKLTYRSFVEDSPKIKFAVEAISQVRKDNKEVGQIIYMPRGVEYFNLLKQYLVKVKGFKSDEIGIIKGGMNVDDKYEVQNRFNEGKVKVLLGTEAIKEGINLQEKATDLYHLHLPWNPTDMLQVEGRLWRQGNGWKNVRITYPLIENSVDSFIFQKLETKEKRIKNLWNYKEQEVSVGDLDFENMKLDLITDPVIRTKAEETFETAQEKAKLQTLEVERAFATRKIKKIDDLKEELKTLTRYKQDALKDDNAEDVKYFSDQIKKTQTEISQKERDLAKQGIKVEELKAKATKLDEQIAERQKAIEELGKKYEQKIKEAEKERITLVAKPNDYVKLREDIALENKTFFVKRKVLKGEFKKIPETLEAKIEPAIVELPQKEVTVITKPPSEPEVETPISKKVDEFVEKLEENYGEAGFVAIPNFEKPDLERLRGFFRKFGTLEEQIGEDAFWQKELFEARRDNNVREITKMVEERLANEKVVGLIGKIPYVDYESAVRITRALERLNFIKEEKRQQLLYKAAAAIKGVDSEGNPIYGTKIQKVEEDGSIKEDWRYTPEEAKLLWSKLTDKEKSILLEYIKPLEEAKILFSRELLKQKAGIEKGVEGYIHKYYEDKIGDRFKKIFFKFRKAAPTKKRVRYINPETGKVEELTGNVENFEKSVIKQIENVVNAQEYNKFIQIWQELLTEPLNEENPLKKGWVEVRGTLKTGIPTDKPRIFKTEEGYGVAPQVRRQTPKEIKEAYMRPIEDAMEAGVISNAIRSVGRYWKGNVLIYPGTAATNFISGGLQYMAKLSDDFYRHGVFGGNFKPFIFDITATMKALLPSSISKVKPEFIGAKVNIATQFGKPKNILDKFISVGLTPFGMIETYWKRVIGIAQLEATGGKTENILKDYNLFKKVGKESDIYAFNYSNIPLWLNKFRASMFGAWLYPFPVYGYKYGRMLGRYTVGSINQIARGNRKEGLVRLLTLASLLTLIYLFFHKDDDEKVGDYVKEMKYAGELDTTGRIKISGTEEKEGFLRVIKYPWLNFFKLLQSGADILEGHKEKGFEQIGGFFQEYISEGAGLQLLLTMIGYRDKFNFYKDDSQIYGSIIKSFIPAFRINEAISILIDPRKIKEETFRQAIERAILFTPTGEQREGFGKKKLEYNRELKLLEFLFGLNIREIDIEEYKQAREQVIQNMIYRIEEDEDASQQSKDRAKEVLNLFNVKEEEYKSYLIDRKIRMKKARKKL